MESNSDFKSEESSMSGTLFLPSNYDVNDDYQRDKLPTILIVGPWLNVKEQVATNYAKRLADKGFAAFVFDFRHWGQSASEPREYECPVDKIADIHNALSYLAERSEVDPNRIGILGVCFGVGYVAAAADDPYIKSVATVAAWVHDVPSITQLYGEKEIARRRQAGRDAMAAYKKDGTVTYVPAGSEIDRTAAMFSPVPNFYYNTPTRGALPMWKNRYAVLGWNEWLDFDGITPAAKITQPLLVVHSDESALPDNARRFFSLATGPKELVWMQGEHTQFYDTEPQISQAVDAVAAHFAKTLITQDERLRRSRKAHAGTHEFFASLEANNIPRFLNVWAENGIQIMPYAPPGFPSRLDGKQAIEKQYSPLPDSFNSMKYYMQSIRTTDDPNVIVVEFKGSISLKSGGRYDNFYVGIFSFNSDGKLSQYTEYFDPFVLLKGFPGAAEMSRKAVEARGS
jgi:uncharacterized protein